MRILKLNQIQITRIELSSAKIPRNNSGDLSGGEGRQFLADCFHLIGRNNYHINIPVHSMNKRTGQRSVRPPLTQCQVVVPITKSQTVTPQGLSAAVEDTSTVSSVAVLALVQCD